MEGKGKVRPCGVWCLLLCMNLSWRPSVGCTWTTPGGHMANSPVWILNPSQDRLMTLPGRSLPSSPTGQGPFIWILCLLSPLPPSPPFSRTLCRDLPQPPENPLSPVLLKPTFLGHQPMQDRLRGSRTCAPFAWESPLELIPPDS